MDSSDPPLVELQLVESPIPEALRESGGTMSIRLAGASAEGPLEKFTIPAGE